MRQLSAITTIQQMLVLRRLEQEMREYVSERAETAMFLALRRASILHYAAGLAMPRPVAVMLITWS